MKETEMDPVNNQEDEDGYVLYPSCPIIEKKDIVDLPPVPLLAGEQNEPVEEEKLIHGFILSPDAPPKG